MIISDRGGDDDNLTPAMLLLPSRRNNVDYLTPATLRGTTTIWRPLRSFFVLNADLHVVLLPLCSFFLSICISFRYSGG